MERDELRGLPHGRRVKERSQRTENRRQKTEGRKEKIED